MLASKGTGSSSHGVQSRSPNAKNPSMLKISGLAPAFFVSLSIRNTVAPSHCQKGQGYVPTLSDLDSTFVDHNLPQFEQIRAARDGRHLVLTYPNMSTSRAGPIVHDGL